MRLDSEDIKRLLELVAGTRDDEIDCDACLAGMAEFAEAALLGVEISVALQRVDDHLTTCPECAEEYALLREAMQSAPAEDA